MRVACDIDGVLYDWSGTAKFLLEHHFGYALETSNEWYYLKKAISKEHWKWIWTEAVTKHGLYRHGNSYKGSFEALNRIAKKHELILVTLRPEQAKIDTYDWIAYHQIPAQEVYVLGPKADKEASVDADILIDDHPGNCESFTKKGKPALLWDRSWNQEAKNLKRVYSWDQVHNELTQNELTQGRF